jgi:hypothetical protein
MRPAPQTVARATSAIWRRNFLFDGVMMRDLKLALSDRDSDLHGTVSAIAILPNPRPGSTGIMFPTLSARRFRMQRRKWTGSRPSGLMTPGVALGLLLIAPMGAFGAHERAAASQRLIVPNDATMAGPAGGLPLRGRSLVSAPSSLIGQGGATRLNFSGALSVRNASGSHPLAIERIDYRNGSGELVEAYVSTPIVLRPYASLQIVVAQDDLRGGPGASFTIDWSAPEDGDAPQIEAFLASFIGTQSYSFTTLGRRVARPQ